MQGDRTYGQDAPYILIARHTATVPQPKMRFISSAKMKFFSSGVRVFLHLAIIAFNT